MCDLITHPGKPSTFCLAGTQYTCTSGADCPSAYLPSGTKLCNMHAEFCMHCGRVFCKQCRTVHQTKCSMRPTFPTLWEVVERVFGESST
jgi:hypothetical protein